MSSFREMIRQIVRAEMKAMLDELMGESSGEEKVLEKIPPRKTRRRKKKPEITELHHQVAQDYRDGKRYADIQIERGVSSAFVLTALKTLMSDEERRSLASKNRSGSRSKSRS